MSSRMRRHHIAAARHTSRGSYSLLVPLLSLVYALTWAEGCSVLLLLGHGSIRLVTGSHDQDLA